MTNTPTPGKRALISGASIAGPALAHWLNAYGWATTVIERAPDLRDAGQNIDIRGAARTVIRRMHMEEQILASGTGEQGTQFVDADGAVKAAFPAGDSDTDGATAEMEILRGQLARLLHERSKPGTEYVFGDHITSIDQSSHGPATVSFAQSQDRQFDVVVIAEGMNSATRGQVFPGEAVIRPLGMYTAYLSIPRTDQDNRWWRWYSATHGRAITLRPDNVGRTRATLSFLSDPRGYENLDPAAQRTVLRTTFADAGWQAHRVLAALTDSEDMYFEQIGQVRAPRWSNGAVVLLGDAAYCASPISGMGTSLALVGAYVLAGELNNNPDPRAAAAAYERIMRPYVAQAQKLPPGAPRLANPKTTLGIKTFHTVLKIGTTRAAQKIGGKLFSPPAEDIDLPDYSRAQ